MSAVANASGPAPVAAAATDFPGRFSDFPGFTQLLLSHNLLTGRCERMSVSGSAYGEESQLRRSSTTGWGRRHQRAAGNRRHRPGRLILAAAAAGLVAAMTGAAPALAAPQGRAAAATPASTPYWTTVKLHGHLIKVHPHGRFGVVHKIGQRHRPQAGSNLVYNG